LTRFRSEPIAFLSISGYDQPTTFVVRDRAMWESTWNQIHRRLTPIPPLPAIDFTADMIGVAALGAQPTSGYDLVLTIASESGGTVTVDVVTRSPAPQCAILPVVTSPVDLARLPRRDGPVVFRLTANAPSC
jgi:protease stability complex PrcB-like protein